LANLGHPVSDQTVGNIRAGMESSLCRNGTKTPPGGVIRRHMDVLAGTDFFTAAVLTWRGLVTYYFSFTWRAGGSPLLASPIVKACWMRLDASDGLPPDICGDGTSQQPPLLARSPNLNAFAKRWVRSV
jgi:hypothetical protein